MDIQRLIIILALCAGLFGTDSPACNAQGNNAPMAPSFAGNLPWDARQQYYEQIPADRGGRDEFESPMDRLFSQAARQSWIQVDYLQWNIGQVSDDLIGASVPGVPRPDLGFTINDTTTGAPPLDPSNTEQTSYVPRLGQIDLNNIPGVKLTYGLDTNYGSLEANAFWILPGTRSFSPGPYVFGGETIPGNESTRFLAPIIDVNGVAAIPFNINGAPSNRALIFDRTFSVLYDSTMFGTELNFVWDDRKPRNGFHFRHILGLRYLKLDEKMRIIGTDNQTTTNAAGDEVDYIKSTVIESRAINQIFGPQVGARIELVDDRITLGAQPMFAFAFNHLDARVNTIDLFAADDPTTIENEATPPTTNSTNQDQFSPVISLALYSKVRATHAMHLYASYDILFLSGVSRPGDNVDYDQNATVDGFGVAPHETTLFNQGFSVGGVFEF
ncbi:MAG: BBP7 family outer membrane beta-barrel protein [Planctomycetaceae bacterium]|nr:BBP7 family outer membrane beta-barrel protein [Planctomycetaceae bacterium]